MQAESMGLQAGGGNGQSNDDWTRRNEPQEHVIIPLIDTKEASYNPFVAPDIREYRKKKTEEDKDVEFQIKNSQ